MHNVGFGVAVDRRRDGDVARSARQFADVAWLTAAVA